MQRKGPQLLGGTPQKSAGCEAEWSARGAPTPAVVLPSLSCLSARAPRASGTDDQTVTGWRAGGAVSNEHTISRRPLEWPARVLGGNRRFEAQALLGRGAEAVQAVRRASRSATCRCASPNLGLPHSVFFLGPRHSIRSSLTVWRPRGGTRPGARVGADDCSMQRQADWTEREKKISCCRPGNWSNLAGTSSTRSGRSLVPGTALSIQKVKRHPENGGSCSGAQETLSVKQRGFRQQGLHKPLRMSATEQGSGTRPGRNPNLLPTFGRHPPMLENGAGERPDAKNLEPPGIEPGTARIKLSAGGTSVVRSPN